MNRNYPIKLFIWGIAALIIITGCSPSSSGTRYNNPSGKKNGKSNAVRFTSEDDKSKDSETVTRNYNQPEFDDTPVEDYPVDTKEFIKKYEKFGELSAALTPREKILFEIVSYLNTPYVYGGQSDSGIDCSGFTQQVMNNTLGIQLPRSASEQFSAGERVSNKTELKFGDLVFFDTRRGSYPGHVGIYIGEDMFAHASSSQGVTISSLKSTYYKSRFLGARRIKGNLE